MQFSGIVIDEFNKPIPFVTVSNLFKKVSRYTSTNINGYFSFVVAEADTILFTTIGYQSKPMIIPSTVNNQSYVKTIQLLTDTIGLPSVTIYPFPTRDEFKRAFINLKVPDNDLDRANYNINPVLLAFLAYNQGMGAEGNANVFFNNIQTKSYTRGQFQSYSVLDVVKVAEFFRLLKEGKISLKNDPPKSLENFRTKP